MKVILCLIFTTLFYVTSYSQESHTTKADHSTNGNEGASRLTLGLGHTHVSEGKIDGKTEWLALPSWTLNYDYWISDKFLDLLGRRLR